VKRRPRLAGIARRTFLAGAILSLLSAAGLLVLHLVFPYPAEVMREADNNRSALILDRQGGLIAWRVGAREDWRLSVSLEEVSPWLVLATVAAEDQRFFSHAGIDPVALARALGQNIRELRRVSGASTVTMQVVRLLRPRPRTLATKAIESFRALQLERLADKEHIAELYVNLAPYGGNVVGAEAASRLYFDKSAAELTLGEAALLAGIPQRPSSFDPRRHLQQALRRREYVLARMLDLKLIGQDQLAAVRREPIVISRTPRRAEAARFADWVISRRGRDCGTVRTTLDPEIQALVRTVLKPHIRKLRNLGVDGIGVVVIGVHNSELLAMIGSADPDDLLIGQVNAATTPRQPGSALKPFIYARAYGSGLLTPDGVVFDVPGTWQGYRPENMDRRFRGAIPARRALVESRNIPAVRLLQSISPGAMAEDMASLGIRLDSAADRCGLSLALGTAEVRLIELANAYAALARLGEFRPLRTARSSPRGAARRVYSRGAAYLTLRSLGASRSGESPAVAWKTGTSWNHRDAWAVAVTPGYAVAVWCGRPSGDGHPGLIGAQAALPIAMDVLDGLPGTTGKWHRPETVRTRRICARSGAPAGTACPRTSEGEFLPGISCETPCRVHRVTGKGKKKQIAEFWPPEVISWLSLSVSCPGAHPGPSRRRTTRPTLVITSPTAGTEYVMVKGDAASNLLQFEARARPGTSFLYWFLDGELLGRSPPGRAMTWPLRPGNHEVLVSDGTLAARPVRFTVLAMKQHVGDEERASRDRRPAR